MLDIKIFDNQYLRQKRGSENVWLKKNCRNFRQQKISDQKAPSIKGLKKKTKIRADVEVKDSKNMKAKTKTQKGLNTTNKNLITTKQKCPMAIFKVKLPLQSPIKKKNDIYQLNQTKIP